MGSVDNKRFTIVERSNHVKMNKVLLSLTVVGVALIRLSSGRSRGVDPVSSISGPDPVNTNIQNQINLVHHREKRGRGSNQYCMKDFHCPNNKRCVRRECQSPPKIDRPELFQNGK